MVPAPFRSLRVLRILNVAGVGLGLAAFISALFAGMLQDSLLVTASTGVPTWILGTIWAWALRWPKTVGKTSFRWGWAASVPLAILNSSIAGGVVMAFDGFTRLERFFVGALLGATFGAMFWIPGLLITLLCFGIPIAQAHRLAKKGLAGEERGEWVVGLASATMSAFGLAIAAATRASHASGLFVPAALGVAGLLAGGTATALAVAREARRRRFVARAEAGEIPGYRIDPTEEGKVLVRVVSQGEGYRVADFEEEVFELGAEGEATRPKVLVEGGR